jgi:hypothetical protein
MANEGRAVILPSTSCRVAPQCTSCGAPQQTQLQTSFSQKRGRVTTTVRMNFPYCAACAAQAKTFTSKHRLAILIAFGLAVLMGALAFLVPALSLGVALAVTAAIGIGGAIGAAIALEPKMPAPPATAKGEAVRIVGLAANGAVTLYFTNALWADAFAQGNGVASMPKSRGDRFVVAPLVLGLLFTPAAALGAWEFAHPPFYVDNPTADALQIFVDGSKKAVVPPSSQIEIDVGHGKHTFGAAKSGTDAPASTVAGVVEVNDAFLYNPNKSGCYWLIADAYGSARTDGIKQGPQPLQEFYHFDHIDTWFGSNPQSIQVGRGESGGTRIALQRSTECMKLVDRGCSTQVRETFVICELAAMSKDAEATCFTQASAACGGRAPSPSTPAAPATATATVTAKPAAVSPTPKTPPKRPH